VCVSSTARTTGIAVFSRGRTRKIVLRCDSMVAPWSAGVSSISAPAFSSQSFGPCALAPERIRSSSAARDSVSRRRSAKSACHPPAET
jgi:hypothetical protein